MGLFQHKQAAAAPDELAPEVFDEQFLKELRDSARQQVERAVRDHASTLSTQLDSAVADMTTSLKEQLAKQLEAAMTRVNSDLSQHLQERLADYDRLTQDAQDQAVQSLNRNAQALHTKYQQLSMTLQQTIASQEAMMIGVFEENKVQMSTTQTAQAAALKTLSETAAAAQEEAEQLRANLDQTIAEQAKAQDAAMQSLQQSVAALEAQYHTLSETLAANVKQQEAMMVEGFESNMAAIVEHYLLGALGEQYDVRAQLPAIIKQLDANKQAMKDDMVL